MNPPQSRLIDCGNGIRLERGVPCLTSLDTARALLLALAAYRSGESFDVRTVDEYLVALDRKETK